MLRAARAFVLHGVYTDFQQTHKPFNPEDFNAEQSLCRACPGYHSIHGERRARRGLKVWPCKQSQRSQPLNKPTLGSRQGYIKETAFVELDGRRAAAAAAAASAAAHAAAAAAAAAA